MRGGQDSFPNLDKAQYDALKKQFNDAARLSQGSEVPEDELELTKRDVRPCGSRSAPRRRSASRCSATTTAAQD